MTVSIQLSEGYMFFRLVYNVNDLVRHVNELRLAILILMIGVYVIILLQIITMCKCCDRSHQKHRVVDLEHEAGLEGVKAYSGGGTRVVMMDTGATGTAAAATDSKPGAGGGYTNLSRSSSMHQFDETNQHATSRPPLAADKSLTQTYTTASVTGPQSQHQLTNRHSSKPNPITDFHQTSSDHDITEPCLKHQHFHHHHHHNGSAVRALSPSRYQDGIVNRPNLSAIIGVSQSASCGSIGHEVAKSDVLDLSGTPIHVVKSKPSWSITNDVSYQNV